MYHFWSISYTLSIVFHKKCSFFNEHFTYRAYCGCPVNICIIAHLCKTVNNYTLKIKYSISLHMFSNRQFSII